MFCDGSLRSVLVRSAPRSHVRITGLLQSHQQQICRCPAVLMQFRRLLRQHPHRARSDVLFGGWPRDLKQQFLFSPRVFSLLQPGQDSIFQFMPAVFRLFLALAGIFVLVLQCRSHDHSRRLGSQASGHCALSCSEIRASGSWQCRALALVA